MLNKCDVKTKMTNKRSSTNIKIGKRIAELRISRRMTQESLAGKLNCTADYISRVEEGDISFNPDFLIRAGELFDCSLDYLIKGGAAPLMPEKPPFAFDFPRSKEERIEKEKELLAAYMCKYSNLHRDVITVPASSSGFFDE